MFKRPPSSTKSSTPVRSSDLRKLRAALPVPSSLQAHLLPDGSTATKLLSHLDEPVTVFSAGGDPLFFRAGKDKDEGVLVPTCYACDRIPNLLPELVTAPQVVANLISGSALFAGGVSDASLEALSDDMKPGALVAITAYGAPQVVAVGQLAATKAEMLRDRKGKAVVTLHARGDFLWKMGSEEEATPLAETSKQGAKTSEPAPIKVPSSLAPEEPLVDLTPLKVSESLSPEATSTTLRTALLFGLKSSPLAVNSFPLAASSLYASHILPYRPAGEGSQAEIKKSGYKKVDKLFKALAKEGVLVCKDVKGDCVVVSYDAKHSEIEAVRGYRTVSQATAAAPSASASSKAGTSIAVRDLVKVPDSLLDLLFSSPPDSELLLPQTLKSALTSYIATNSLTHARDGKYAILNESLAPFVVSSGKDKGAAPRPPTGKAVGTFKVGEDVGDVMAKDEIWKRVKERCVAWYGVSIDGSEEVHKKGTPPRVKIALKPVGKRTVTLVSGLEAWAALVSALDNDAVAEELRHRAASSTAVQQMTGSSPKHPKFEVMVQGSHEVLVTKALTERGLPKLYIDVDTSKMKR